MVWSLWCQPLQSVIQLNCTTLRCWTLTSVQCFDGLLHYFDILLKFDFQEKKKKRVAGRLRRKGGCKQRTIRQSENAQITPREHLEEWLAGPKRRVQVDCK